MNARQLFQAGKLNEAIEALSAELRDNPADAQRRTFLFELLCFAGNYDRAEKHLDYLSQASADAAMGALVYRSSLHAERIRQQMFKEDNLPLAAPVSREIRGVLNGKRFETLEDADPRIGARLEIFAAGQYTWIPLAHIASVRMEPPKRLRDLLWIPALVRTGPEFRGQELGEVLIPALCPLSYEHPDDNVRLGRATEWRELEGGDFAPVGQKLLLADDEDIPFLEIRELEIDAVQKAAS
jgi:type VI secretion system protein ImpE